MLQVCLYPAAHGAWLSVKGSAEVRRSAVARVSRSAGATSVLAAGKWRITHRFVDQHFSVRPYAVANNQTITQVLTSHSQSATAGLLVQFRSQVLGQQHNTHRITNMQILDDRGEKVTEVLDH